MMFGGTGSFIMPCQWLKNAPVASDLFSGADLVLLADHGNRAYKEPMQLFPGARFSR